MHGIRPERVIALERENTELRECIDKLFKQITELSAKYEAPADAVVTQQRALYDVPSHGITNEMYLKLMTTKQLAAWYARNFFCQSYMKMASAGCKPDDRSLDGRLSFVTVQQCPLKELCDELDKTAPEGVVYECEDVVEHWLKTQQFKTFEQYLTALNLDNQKMEDKDDDN